MSTREKLAKFLIKYRPVTSMFLHIESGAWCCMSHQNEMLEEADQILALLKENGWVEKDPEQKLPEEIVCRKCEGSGVVYADGKSHYPSEHAQATTCSYCCGNGRVSVSPQDMITAGWVKIRVDKT